MVARRQRRGVNTKWGHRKLLCGDGIVLYLGHGYMVLYIGQNCIELYAHTNE